MSVEIRSVSGDDVASSLRPIWVAFGGEPTADDGSDRLAALFDDGRMHSAYDDGAVVGSAGAFTYELTTPGGTVPAAGVTVVAVLPTHRRRGILRGLMRTQLDDVRARGEAVAILWASEERIYGRFGYGLASLRLETEIEPRHVGFRNDERLPVNARIVDEQEAARLIPPIYDAVRARTPGMVSRSPEWWQKRRLFDSPQQARGAGSLFRVVLEHDGDPVAYALYRLKMDFGQDFGAELFVTEAMGVSTAPTREIWRYIFDVDLVRKVRAGLLPVDHPLLLMLDQPRKLSARIVDALWCRVVDVPAALRARAYGEGVVVFELSDAFERSNEGRWRLDGGEATRTDAEPDLRLDVSALGSAYLGGFTFSELLRAGQVEEMRAGGAARADAVFATGHPKPWNVEIF